MSAEPKKTGSKPDAWKTVARRIRRIYGRDVARYLGSPHEGEGILNDAELCLHEICHMAFLPPRSISLGEFDLHFETIGDAIDRMPDGIADRHEVRTIATELLVARALGLPLRTSSVMRAGYSNTKMRSAALRLRALGEEGTMRRCDLKLFRRLVERASNTPAVKRATQNVLYLISDLGCRRGVKNKTWSA